MSWDCQDWDCDMFTSPIPLEELGWTNSVYLGNARSACDPMIVWGTTVETERLDAFLVEQRRKSGAIISGAHVLVRAVAESLRQHPKLNRRVVGRRVHQYDGVNISVPMLQTRTGEVEMIFLRRAETLSLTEIAETFWNEARARAQKSAELRTTRLEPEPSTWIEALRQRRLKFRKWFRPKLRLHWIHKMSWLAIAYANTYAIPTWWNWQRQLNGVGAVVNYFGFAGAPSMIMFKPSAMPLSASSVSVTMGPSEPRTVPLDNAVVVRNQAPLFVRFDHRMVNTFQAAAFIKTLVSHLADPWTLVEPDADVAKAA